MILYGNVSFDWFIYSNYVGQEFTKVGRYL